MGTSSTVEKPTVQQSSGSGTTAPWKPQQPFLTAGLNAASNALTEAQGAPKPTDFVAGYSPEAINAFRTALGYGTSNLGIPGASASAGGALSSSGTDAAAQGLTGLANFSPNNSVSNVLDAARAYSANPDVQGMIDAATRDARNSVAEQYLPQIDRTAASTGNINSNRTQIAKGIVERGLANTVADTSANIRGNLYNSGLQLANQQGATSDAQRLAALGALTSGGTGAAGTGINANTGAVNQAQGLFGIANTGAGNEQVAAQAPLSNAIAANAFGVSSPFAALNNYWNIVGKPLGAQTSSSGTQYGNTTQTSTPSDLQTIAGYIGLAGSLFG